MDVSNAIGSRRAYRSLEAVPIEESLVRDLAESAGLSPSCFNNQPWRFVFVYDKDVLATFFSVLNRGNRWAKAASMIVAVCSNRELDCIVKGREYHLFDTGMATAFMILRATELGLVAHPIAGYGEAKAKELLGIPEDLTIITLVIFGKHSKEISPVLSEDQVKKEKVRPERLPLEDFAFHNAYSGPDYSAGGP